MDPDETTTFEPEDDDEDGLGRHFYLRLAGILVVVGIVMFVMFLIFFRALYAWGLLGAFIALGAMFALLGWLYDRRGQP
jgi:hypothetical protein